MKPIKVWEPFAGSQTRFMSCPVWEVLLHGNRGGGKTDVLIMDFLQEVGVGHGIDYKGLLLREATTELGDVITKTKKWVPKIFPTAKYNNQKKIWTFEDGETLWLNYARVPDDYEQYHGHEYPWIGWEELTNHPFDTLYLKLMSCNRSSNSKIPRKYRSTCNPSGPGHGWVKQRFIDAGKAEHVIKEKMEVIYPDSKGIEIKKEITISRTHIKSYQMENKALAEADPLYMAKIYTLTKNNDMLRKAWVDGSWDLIIGGFFTDVWEPKIHVMDSFKVPRSWKLIRSFDWGSSKPWAVTYAFETNGEQPDPMYLGGYEVPYIPKKSIIVANEIYGWNGNVNEGDQATSQQIANRVLGVDNIMLTEYGIRCIPGPADTSIYEVRDGTSIGANLATHGCHWTKAYKGSGSRIAGWAIIRQMLGAAKRKELETPHLYFFRQAQHHIRTLPIMQRDDKKPEDIDSSLEDHCFVYDTKIITDKGMKKIGDLVGTSGNVLSVNGEFVPYENCRLTQKNTEVIQVTFNDGFSVRCTPDHKFLTTNGFVKAKDLTLLDIHCILSQPKIEGDDFLCKNLDVLKESEFYQKQSKNLMGKYIIGVVNIFKKMGEGYTEKFGCIIKEKYQKDFMFIIKMGIKQIINLKTWNYCLIPAICLYTKQDTHGQFQRNALRRRQSGTKGKREKHGILNIMKTQKKHFMKKLNEIVQIVEKYIPLNGKRKMPFVAMPVKQLGEKNLELMMLQENVQYVPVHLQLTNTHCAKPVQVYAHQNFVQEVIKINTVNETFGVYCLTVPKYHTFALENGVIVSNCMDSLRYLSARKLTTMKRRKVKN